MTLPTDSHRLPKKVMGTVDVLRTYFPKEYAKRKVEGRCLHCGAKKPESTIKMDKR